MNNVPLLSQLEGYLSVANRRQTVIAANMANIDTPGYRTKDIDFQHELARSMAAQDGESPSVEVRDVQGLLERPDGNNVDIDKQSVELAETQLQYQMGTQLIKERFHQLLSAINGDQ